MSFCKYTFLMQQHYFKMIKLSVCKLPKGVIRESKIRNCRQTYMIKFPKPDTETQNADNIMNTTKGLKKRNLRLSIKLRSFKSSEYINEKGDGPYRRFGYSSLVSDPLDLANRVKKAIVGVEIENTKYLLIKCSPVPGRIHSLTSF